MSKINIIKIISIVLLFIIILSFVPNTSRAADNKSEFTFEKFMNNVIDTIKNIIKSIFVRPTVPIGPSASFASVASDCKKVLRDEKFSYSYGAWSGINFSNGNDSNNPASENRGRTTIDCSGYVSWVLYKYGCQTGKEKYKELFYTPQATSNMKSIFDNNAEYFEHVGNLGEIKDDGNKDLKKGDILIRSGTHVEIYSFHGTVHNNSNPEEITSNRYGCYSAGATNQIRNPYLDPYGSCNGSEDNYEVYRVKK